MINTNPIYRAVTVDACDECPDRATYAEAILDAVGEAQSLREVTGEFGPEVMGETIAIHYLEDAESTPRVVISETAEWWLK